MYFGVRFLVAYIIGILAYRFDCVTTALICMLIYVVIYYIIKKKLFANIILTLFLVLSIINTNYNSKSVLVQHIDSTLQLKINVIDSNKSDTDSRFNSYNVKVIGINNNQVNERSILYVDKKTELPENSVIMINGQIAEISSSKNRGLFSYKDYMRSKKVYVNIFATGETGIVRTNYSRALQRSNDFKLYIEKLFKSNMSEQNAGIMLSIILGDKDYLNEDIYKDVQRIGLAHIFAVSGLHIGILYGALLFIFMKAGLGRRSRWTLVWIILWGYGFLIGYPVSVLRTLFMFTLLFIGAVLYRRYSPINSIAYAALVILIINPYSLFDTGFMLSFSAALSLILYNRYMRKKLYFRTKNGNTIFMYIFVQVFSLPIVIYTFNYIQLASVVYNIILIPVFTAILIMSFILIPVSMLSYYTVIIPFKLMDYLLYGLMYLIGKTSSIKLLDLSISSVTIIQSIAYYLFLFMVIYIIKQKKFVYRKFIFSSFMIFYIFTYIVPFINNNSFYLNVADSGQGLFTVSSYKGKSIIIDSGSNSKGFGKYTALPYLVKNNLTNIKAVFVSHYHDDHYSGIGDITDEYNVDRVFVSHKDTEDLLDTSEYTITEGDRITYDGKIVIDVLWPDIEYNSSNENNMSNIYLMRVNDKKILFAGDIESEVENFISEDLEEVDILIVPHHGSKTSSTESFIMNTNPTVAIMSYGKNSYGIPSKEVINRYKENGTILLSTFEDGEINFIVNNDEIYYNTYTGRKSDNYYKLYINNLIINICVFALIVILFYRNRLYIYDSYKEYYGLQGFDEENFI